MTDARRFVLRGTVQGVGFRPFVARLARAHRLAGWIRNGGHGVEIHVEGTVSAIDAFAGALETGGPPAASIVSIDVAGATREGFDGFRVRESDCGRAPTVRMSPDLPVCDECLEEMRDPAARRFEYPYINCTNCGPRFSLIEALPYDRERTTMAAWPLCEACHAEYLDPEDRRFHAEPIACPVCGPRYRLCVPADGRDDRTGAIARGAQLLQRGAVLAIKGVGGYHLCCDARNAAAIAAVRERKYRKSRPFAVMAADLAVARSLVELDAAAEALLTSAARPIVLAPARCSLAGVAPGRHELGVMLPYAPVHHLLFRAGAPSAVVMTSANRSSEPIAYDDTDAQERLTGIADAFLTGERRIARRVDDSVVRPGTGGPIVLRRARGYSPAAVCRLTARRPILAVGADLKNSVTLVVGGDAVVSQHIGDLDHASARDAFRDTVRDLVAMYELDWNDLLIAHDSHPHYASTGYALELPATRRLAVQHHRAHVASVLAEHGALDTPVVGIVCDGTGYGDDGTIWGGEFFVGSVAGHLARAASIRPFPLPGGDAAARAPVQAAAGVLHALGEFPELTAPPFNFPVRYTHARRLVSSGVRTFACTSAGRLFDAAAAILGFTSEIEYEGQAAEWLEQLAWGAPARDPLPFAVTGGQLDFGPALVAMIARRKAGDGEAALARAFHEGVAAGVAAMAVRLCEANDVHILAVSGGTFQNALLVESLRRRLPAAVTLWMNGRVPPNDGGISLGQAACASVSGVL